MKVIMIGFDFAPDVAGIAPYTTGLAEELSRLGHQVTVITSFPHYPLYRWSEPARVRFPWSTEAMGNIRLRRVWALLQRKNKAAWRVAMDLSFAVMAFFAALTASRGADVIISVCVPAPAGLVGGALARLRGARGVFWVQDLPLEAAIATGLISPDGLIPRLGRALERLACRANHRVVVLSEAFANYVTALGVDRDAISTIPNWSLEFEPTQEMEPTGERESLGFSPNKFVLVHSGNLGEKQGLDAFIRAMRPLAPAVALLIIGGGSAEGAVRGAAAEVGLEMKCFDFQPRERLLQLLRSADAALLTQVPNVTTSVVPSKVLTYMAAGRPIFAAVNPASSAADLVRGASCGVIAGGPPETVVGALRDFMRLATDEREMMGARGVRFAAMRFSRSAVMARWAAVLLPA